MRTTYKIRVRKDPKGNPFYQLTIPREWIERTRATEIQFKNGDGNQLIIDPVTFSDKIPIEHRDANESELKYEKGMDELIRNMDMVNKKYKR